jgi:hypothetical protein
MSALSARIAIALALLAAAISLLDGTIPGISFALAHSWYPDKCCGGQDCKVVDSIDLLPDGDQLFHAGPISVVVPAEFKRLPSQDNNVHVCVYRIGSGEYRPRCVFVPGES